MTTETTIEQVVILAAALLDGRNRLNVAAVTEPWARLSGLDELDAPMMTVELMAAVDAGRDVTVRLVEIVTDSGRTMRAIDVTDGRFTKRDRV